MNKSVGRIINLKRAMSFLTALAFCIFTTQSYAYLPDLGDPADAIITPEEEYILGQQLLVDVRNQLPMIDDAEPQLLLE